MENEALKCPGCGEKMHEVKAPDVTIDECEKCGGVWLDRGELNILATGIAGDIEYCAAEHVVASASFPDRPCPLCGQTMVTVTLLRHSDLILDLCESCHGFYLDKGEVEKMNAELIKLSLVSGGDEFRGEIDGQFVTLDKLSEVKMQAILLGLGEAPVYQQSLRFAVFFKEPLGLGLRLSPDSVTKRFTKALGISRRQDIKTGDAAFDRAFVIEGDDEAAVKALLTAEVRTSLVTLHDNPPQIFGSAGILEVVDNRVIYTEGPYAREIGYDAQQDPKRVVAALAKVAAAVDAARS